VTACYKPPRNRQHVTLFAAENAELANGNSDAQGAREVFCLAD
jgi:hypothetical protein